MKTIAFAAAAAFGLSAAAFADHHMAGPAGQSFEISSGEESYVGTFNADGTYTTDTGAEMGWTFEEGELCLTAMTEEGEEDTTCNAWEGMAVGDSVTTSEWSDDGSEITIERIE
ncbi:hypothetical protein DDZ18_10755 [Marinicauda salina]|uniref:Uncharacterized protein n=1 Tax=Marinicauda salina TaxID=2135793 RepID=A0A2U2BRQ8_9PROT|nr:hypothetical protein [Marinicauda salina]PWE16682.1 hypothetical protein DDZ18_10755 [Marinicauda salina]